MDTETLTQLEIKLNKIGSYLILFLIFSFPAFSNANVNEKCFLIIHV